MPETTTTTAGMLPGGSMTDGFMPPAERARVGAAIQAAERQTSGEIVAVVASESDSYLWAPILAAALAALAVAAPLILFTWMNVHWIYVIQVLTFALLAVVLMQAPFRHMLVPRAVKHARAHSRAVEQFLVQNLHTTSGRTGVLIFVSVAERYAEIIADAAVHKKIDANGWQAIVDTLTSAIADGRTGDGFVAAIERCGAVLAEHFPPGTHDPHSLPDHLIVLD